MRGMERSGNEKFIILLVSLGCIGLLIENLLLDWEFWVPPIIMIAVISLWVMNLLEKPKYEVRTVIYFVYAMLAAFYHGVHASSFFDVTLVITFAMVGFSLLDHVYMMNLLLIEYISLMLVQFMISYFDHIISTDILSISRIVLHVAVAVLIYFSCVRAITNRNENMRLDQKKNEQIESYDADMEDFLSNISHELRTPVNVVNGMSDLLIKRKVGYEAGAIKNAGIRLSYQIEDIQDYTECKRNKVVLEEEEYMSTSLINDVVTGFRLIDNSNDLELIVDLDPKVPTKMKGDVNKLHKIFRHLLENAVKFTKRGGIYVKMYSENTEYGVNLCIEMTDTGIGMDSRTTRIVSEGMYQVNKKRNRSSGGIGLGLFIVYGFTHSMGGFVIIESQKGAGTTVRVTIPQKVAEMDPCLILSDSFEGDVLFHVRSDKYKVPRVRDFYRYMASNLASGIKVPLYPAENRTEIERLMKKLNVKIIFMGEEEYAENSSYFDELSKKDIVVAVSASDKFKANTGSGVIVMPKPLYAYPVIKILNEGKDADTGSLSANREKPVFDGVRALIVDDEPMNLVVATGLFKDYKMIIDTAGSGKEAIGKFSDNTYDVIFMDHMMPEMDGVEAMKRIKADAKNQHRDIKIIALTANAVSGAREMFMKEGFDGFIAKPINLADFERVMLRELKSTSSERKGK